MWSQSKFFLSRSGEAKAAFRLRIKICQVSHQICRKDVEKDF